MQTRKVEQLSGAELRLALAVTLKMSYEISIEPAYQVGARIRVGGTFEFFRPDKEWKQAGPLIEQHWVAITKWLYKHFGHTWVGYVDRSTDTVLVWFMRALVGHYNPTLTGVPFDELSLRNSNDG